MKYIKYILLLTFVIIFFPLLTNLTSTNKILDEYRFEYDKNKIDAIYSITENKYIAKNIEHIYFENKDKMYIITNNEYIIIKTNINEIVKVSNLEDFEISDEYKFKNLINKDKNELKKQEKLDKIYVVAPILIVLIPILILNKRKEKK